MEDEKIEKSIEELKAKFLEIKKIPFHKSLRKGSTGIGYTFERLIGKKEDSSYKPDYKGIELKTKLGYSKSPLTLFGLIGKKDDGPSVYKYLIDNFGYYRSDGKKQKRLAGEIYTNTLTRTKSGFLWKLKIDLKENKIKLLIVDCNYKIINDSIYWNLNDVCERLLIKLNYMAIIKGYPYKYKGDLYYKYTNLYIYKLKGFDEFLKLLEKGYIFVCLNISYDIENGGIKLNDRHVAFRLKINCIDNLFKRIY